MTGHTDNEISIEAPLDFVWRVTNEIRDWPRLFTEYASVEVLEEEYSNVKELARIVFRLTTHPDEEGNVYSWVSERCPDPATYTVRAKRIETGPFEYMNLRWIYTQDTDGAGPPHTRLRWIQDFAAKPSAPADDAGFEEYLNKNTAVQLKAIKERIEERHAHVRSTVDVPANRRRGGEIRYRPESRHRRFAGRLPGHPRACPRRTGQRALPPVLGGVPVRHRGLRHREPGRHAARGACTGGHLDPPQRPAPGEQRAGHAGPRRLPAGPAGTAPGAWARGHRTAAGRTGAGHGSGGLTERRSVVTGIGVVAPGGAARERFWIAHHEGPAAIRRITFFDPSPFRSQIAAECDFDPVAGRDSTRRSGGAADRSVQFAARLLRRGGRRQRAHARQAGRDRAGRGARAPPSAAPWRWSRSTCVVSDSGRRLAGRPRPSAGRTCTGAGAQQPGRATWPAGTACTARPQVVSTGCTSGIDAIGYAHQLIEDDEATWCWPVRRLADLADHRRLVRRDRGHQPRQRRPGRGVPAVRRGPARVRARRGRAVLVHGGTDPRPPPGRARSTARWPATPTAATDST